MSETTAEITITVVCHDCTPEEAAARMMTKMPDDPAWYSVGGGEFEIHDAWVS